MDGQSLDFELPSYGVLRGLDQAYERGSWDFFRNRVSEMSQRLSRDLKGHQPPNYEDPIVAAAYLETYHVSHCMMAYWAFGALFDYLDFLANKLYVCDIGAGTGAGRIGLALALLEREESPTAIYFDSIEPSSEMRTAGKFFADALPRNVGEIVTSFNYGESAAVPAWLPDDIRVDATTLRVVTAFHMSLPYDNRLGVDIAFTRHGESSRCARRSIQSALRLVSPHIGLFTANSKKKDSLAWVVGSPGHWGDGSSDEFDIPRDGISSGFSHFRPPYDAVLLRCVCDGEVQRLVAALRTEEEERERQRAETEWGSIDPDDMPF